MPSQEKIQSIEICRWTFLAAIHNFRVLPHFSCLAVSEKNVDDGQLACIADLLTQRLPNGLS
jgi:hypothetical protein